MITRIEAYNYRCFERLSVDLGRYHVLAGANGAGKTTLIDIPVLLGDMLRSRRAVEAFLLQAPRGDQAPRAATLTDLLHKGLGDSIAFAIEASLPAEVVEALAETSLARLERPVPTHLRYELRLEITPRTMQVVDEYLFLFASTSGEHLDLDGRDEIVIPGQPEPGLFPQGLPESGSDLDHPHWQPVLIREGRAPARFFPEVDIRDSPGRASSHSGTSSALTAEALLRAGTEANDETEVDGDPETPPVPEEPEALSILVSGDRLALGAIPPDSTIFPAAVGFLELLRDEIVFYAPSWDTLRRPSPPGASERVIASGNNLPWLALTLQESDPDEFEAWQAHVRGALPQIRRIQAIEREEDHYAYFSVDYQGGYRVTSSSLSDGTLRVLALSILPFLAPKTLPGLLVTEEPENGIYPRAIETVVESLASFYDRQVWVSTHSPLVIAKTELANVLATRLTGDGAVTVVHGDEHPQLRDWQGGIDLGTLFASGVFS